MIEQHGIDRIPDTERHGRPWQLGVLWSSMTLNVQYVIYGALLIAFGLTPWQSLCAILVGNLAWVITGVISLSGPAAGRTTFAISRSAFGRNGNRPVALFNWVMQVGYEVLQLVLMVLAAVALFAMMHIHIGTGGKITLVIALAVVQSLLPLVGHAAITRALRVLAVPFAGLFVVFTWLTADRLDLHAGHPAGWAATFGGIALVASAGGLGWTPNAADYSRYLPAATPRGRLVASVALGGALPQIALMLLGVGVATVTSKAADPVSGLSGKYPTWFLVGYLMLLIVQMLAANAFDLYSSGVTLQAMGVRIARWQAVVVDGIICAAVTVAVVLSDSFYSYVSDFLLFMIVWFAPWAAIYTVDYVLRRGQYEAGTAQQDGRRRGNGIRLPGVIAQAGGMVASALYINTSVYVGPLAKAGDGIDLSIPAGMAVGAGLYWLLSITRVSAPARDGDAVVTRGFVEASS